jgi:hypothetical protein
VTLRLAVDALTEARDTTDAAHILSRIEYAGKCLVDARKHVEEHKANVLAKSKE